MTDELEEKLHEFEDFIEKEDKIVHQIKSDQRIELKEVHKLFKDQIELINQIIGHDQALRKSTKFALKFDFYKRLFAAGIQEEVKGELRVVRRNILGDMHRNLILVENPQQITLKDIIESRNHYIKYRRYVKRLLGNKKDEAQEVRIEATRGTLKGIKRGDKRLINGLKTFRKTINHIIDRIDNLATHGARLFAGDLLDATKNFRAFREKVNLPSNLGGKIYDANSVDSLIVAANKYKIEKLLFDVKNDLTFILKSNLTTLSSPFTSS